MRMLVKMTIPAESGSKAIAEGRMPTLMQSFMERAKPECAYFTVLDGKRCMIVVLDLASPADLPPLFEPSFREVGAALEIAPAMNMEDLQKGLAKLAAG
jgi:hypothetical protein